MPCSLRVRGVPSGVRVASGSSVIVNKRQLNILRSCVCLLGIVCVAQQQFVSADQASSSSPSVFGGWPSQVIKQLQDAISKPLKSLLGLSESDASPELSELSELPLVVNYPLPFGVDFVERDYDREPQKDAKISIDYLSGAVHGVAYLSRQLQGLKASLLTGVAHRQSQRRQQGAAAQRWEVHECLHVFGFAASAASDLHRRPLEGLFEATRERVKEVLRPHDADENQQQQQRQQQQQQQQQRQQQHQQQEQQRASLKDLIARPFMGRPRERSNRAMLLTLERKMASLEAKYHQNASAVDADADWLRNWAETCAMEAIIYLRQEVGAASAAIDAMEAAGEAFRADAAEANQQLLQLFRDRHTMAETMMDVETAVKEVLQPAVERLAAALTDLEQRQWPLLQQVEATRLKLELLADAVAVAALSDTRDDSSSGKWPFSRALLRQRDSISAHSFDEQLLQWQQYNREVVVSILEKQTEALRGYLASQEDANEMDREQDRLRALIALHPPLGGPLEQQHHQGFIDLTNAAVALRETAMQLGAAIREAAEVLSSQDTAADPLGGLEAEGLQTATDARKLPAAALVQAMKALKQEASKKIGVLSSINKSVEASSSAYRAAESIGATAAAALGTNPQQQQQQQQEGEDAAAAADSPESTPNLDKESGDSEADTATSSGAAAAAEKGQAAAAAAAKEEPVAAAAAAAEEQSAAAAAAEEEPAAAAAAEEEPSGAAAAEEPVVAAAPVERQGAAVVAAAARGLLGSRGGSTVTMLIQRQPESVSGSANFSVMTQQSFHSAFLRDLEEALHEAVQTYREAEELLSAAVAAAAAVQNRKALEFRKRQVREVKLALEGTRESSRQLIKQKAMELDCHISSGIRRCRRWISNNSNKGSP